MNLTNYLTIDVEDYFQVLAFADIVPLDTWDTYPSRVVDNTRRILSILEKQDVKATFFILGWTANKHPELVSEINTKGHEIACHSFYHRPIYKLSPEEFKKDTAKSKDILEQITGKKIQGYRAPSYSITRDSLWALDILEELGFTYDSSIFPVHHDNYGIPDAPRFEYTIPNSTLKEYPISTLNIAGYKLPVAGGGYFRLFPYWFTKMALQRINTADRQPFIFYLHPWEFDPNQPKFNKARKKSKFRHYINLDKTNLRFEKLLNVFTFSSIEQTHLLT